MATRIRPKIVAVRSVRNQSSRGGVRVQAIVLHSTESSNRTGKGDLLAIADWFNNPSAQASSHICIDAEGQTVRMVRDDKKSWACAAYNSQVLNVEQVGRAAQTHWTRDEIREAARWVALWSLKYKIPIQRGAVSNGRVTRRGVLTHSQLGAAGGGHHDPGSHYPLNDVLHLARFYRGKLLAAR